VIACQYELKFPSSGYTVRVHLEGDPDEHCHKPGVWRAAGGYAQAGVGEGSGIDENFRPAENVYPVMLCGLPWCAVIIIKSDDYCA
jgi:hypothetical protein